ncbi:antibiotic biosynthesis monooxygenase [bacterium SCSIO 12696]|nr:antibiotic biosynthesis monooxygenase [bacterium SCSIO 12696]
MTYAVIFTATPTPQGKGDSYSQTAQRMRHLAEQQPGFIGISSAFEGDTEITVSYWESLAAIKAWKANSEHLDAQRLGREQWYQKYKVEVVKVERCYEFEN